jgi:hypothetical protein
LYSLEHHRRASGAHTQPSVRSDVAGVAAGVAASAAVSAGDSVAVNATVGSVVGVAAGIAASAADDYPWSQCAEHDLLFTDPYQGEHTQHWPRGDDHRCNRCLDSLGGWTECGLAS